jgi:hypothetical protein
VYAILSKVSFISKLSPTFLLLLGRLVRRKEKEAYWNTSLWFLAVGVFSKRQSFTTYNDVAVLDVIIIPSPGSLIGPTMRWRKSMRESLWDSLLFHLFPLSP